MHRHRATSCLIGVAAGALWSAWALLAGCDGGGAQGDREECVLMLAAASAEEALRELGGLLRDARGIELVISTGASGAMTRQIEAGAPVDLFLSAGPAWVDELAAKGRVARSVALLGNQLVIVTARGNAPGVRVPSDLTGGAVHRVALAGEAAPAGVYARAALESLGLLEGLDDTGKIVTGESVRTALAYVERGEVEAGIVYMTDARAAGDERVEVAYVFDESTHGPILYSLALIDRAGEGDGAAREVFEFLASPDAAAVFERHGFRALAGAGRN